MSRPGQWLVRVRRSGLLSTLGVRLGAVLVVPLLVYAAYATANKALDNHRLNEQAEALRLEIRALRQENLQLQEELELARTDAAVEAIARRELGLVKPGDQAVALIAPPGRSPGAPAPGVPPAPPPTTPIWRQWWDVFFGPAGGT